MAVKQHIKDEERHPLQTRHVFLDTQVYRSLSFNIANPAMQQLRNHVSEYRIVLHVTDITLKELELQITELVADKRRQLVETEKHLNRWRKQAPQNSPKGKFDFDAEALAAELMSTLSNFILTDCNATLHNASAINAVPVFEKYFKRLPPFDDEKSRKEFPDAFVIECLGDWASSNNQDMYVTTRDAAFLRAVDQHSRLFPLRSINEVVSRAQVAYSADILRAAEDAINAPSFDYTLERCIENHLTDITFTYVGDLDNGEAYEGQLIKIEAVDDWSVVNAGPKRATLLLSVPCQIEVDVDFDDRSLAFFDREDDRWYGVETASTKIVDTVSIELMAEIDLSSGKVLGAELLASEIDVSGSPESDF